MAKEKLLISELILSEIERKHDIKIIKELNKYPREFNYGDFVISIHGISGFIKNTYNLKKDIRVEIGDGVYTSITGEDGYDTLEINSFHVFEVVKNEI